MPLLAWRSQTYPLPAPAAAQHVARGLVALDPTPLVASRSFRSRARHVAACHRRSWPRLRRARGPTQPRRCETPVQTHPKSTTMQPNWKRGAGCLTRPSLRVLASRRREEVCYCASSTANPSASTPPHSQPRATISTPTLTSVLPSVLSSALCSLLCFSLLLHVSLRLASVPASALAVVTQFSPICLLALMYGLVRTLLCLSYSVSFLSAWRFFGGLLAPTSQP